MILQNTRTILFASLISAIMLSGMQMADAKEGDSDIEKLTAYEEWVLEILDEKSDEQKMQSIEKLRAFVDTLDGYEAFIFDKVEGIAEAEKQVNFAKEQNKPDQIIQELEMKLMTLYFELEEYGVTTKDRFDANPEYWKSRASSAKIAMETPNTNNVNMSERNSSLHYIHQTDLALKRTSILTIPLFGHGPATLPFPVTTYGWNQGTSTSSWGFIANPTGGTVTYESIVCLDSPTHHDSVDFEMNSNGNTKNIFGQIQFHFNQDMDVTHSDSGDCKTYTRTTAIPSTYSATLSTTVSGISLN